jgi:hypothetical protein
VPIIKAGGSIKFRFIPVQCITRSTQGTQIDFYRFCQKFFLGKKIVIYNKIECRFDEDLQISVRFDLAAVTMRGTVFCAITRTGVIKPNVSEEHIASMIKLKD